MKRFTRNTFFTEKNPTIINFPINNVDFSDLLPPEIRRVNTENVYELVANIVHEGEPNKGELTVKHISIIYPKINKKFAGHRSIFAVAFTSEKM